MESVCIRAKIESGHACAAVRWLAYKRGHVTTVSMSCSGVGVRTEGGIEDGCYTLSGVSLGLQ